MNTAWTRERLERVVREVVSEHAGSGSPRGAAGVRTRDLSGVTAIDVPRLVTAPFPFPLDVPPGSVRLVDGLTLDESPRLGCGVMELDRAAFDWTLRYDEIDYIIDGTLELIIDGRTVRASAGQALFIPANTALRFSAPGTVRFFYVVYPANWSEQ